MTFQPSHCLVGYFTLYSAASIQGIKKYIYVRFYVYTFILHCHTIIISELLTRSIPILKTSLIKSLLIFLETTTSPVTNATTPSSGMINCNTRRTGLDIREVKHDVNGRRQTAKITFDFEFAIFLRRKV